MRDISDTVMTLAAIAPLAQGPTMIRNVGNIRIKETDRIATVADNLQRMGATIQVAADGFHVPGKQKLRGAEIDSFGDHRIAMAFAVAGLAAEGYTLIRGAEAASVSFPEFFSLLRGITD